jgi:FemAB-related protein (PEP-CTERM system-associated)
VLDLPPVGEDLWRSFTPKVRNQIRKAEKEGLRTAALGGERWNEFYGVFARNMRDLGSPVHSRRLFQALFAAFGADASLYLTNDREGRVVAGAVALSSGGVVTVPWASALRERLPSCPNHSLYWKILADAVEAGARAFDFGRSHEDSGTFHFKRQWGAEPRPLLWRSFDARGAPAADAVLKPSEHTILTGFWRCLPVAVANQVGPFLRGRLSN